MATTTCVGANVLTRVASAATARCPIPGCLSIIPNVSLLLVGGYNNKGSAEINWVWPWFPIQHLSTTFPIILKIIVISILNNRLLCKTHQIFLSCHPQLSSSSKAFNCPLLDRRNTSLSSTILILTLFVLYYRSTGLLGVCHFAPYTQELGFDVTLWIWLLPYTNIFLRCLHLIFFLTHRVLRIYSFITRTYLY